MNRKTTIMAAFYSALFIMNCALLASCSADEHTATDGSMSDGEYPLRIASATVSEGQTRATHNLDKQLKDGEKVCVWVDDAGNVTNKSLYIAEELTVGSGGILTGKKMYFPKTGNAVDIYALHGNFEDVTDWSEGNFWGQGITHKVAADQRTGQQSDGYALSDLVYAKKTGVARTKETVSMEFKHLLSKVEIVLVQGAGSPTISKMEILNTKPDAVFTPDKESDFQVKDSGTVGVIETDYDLTPAADAAGDDESKKTLNEAIIVPQTIAKGTQFIRITTTDGGELIYSLSNETTFEPAMKYRYTITANLTELAVRAEIQPWRNGERFSGDAIMQ